MCLPNISPFHIFTDFESGNVGMAVGIPVLLLVLVVIVVMIMRRRSCRPLKSSADNSPIGLPDLETR